MKSWEFIKKHKRNNDHASIAELTGLAKDTVRKIVNGTRKDHHGVQEAYSLLLEERAELKAQRKAKRMAFLNKKTTA